MVVLERTQRAILLALVVGIPLLMLPEITRDPYSLPKLALLVIGVGCAGGLALVRLIVFRTAPARGVLLPIAALTTPLVVAWVTSPYRSFGLFGQYPRFNGLIPYILLGLFGLLLHDSFRDRPQTLAIALAFCGAMVGTYALIQALALDPFWSPGLGSSAGSGSEYPPSTIGHFNFTGGFLAIALPIGIWLWAQEGQKRFLGLWSTVACATGLVLTNSQGAWAAALAGTLIVAGSFLGRRWRPARAAGFIAAALVAAVVVAAVITSLLIPEVGSLGGTVRQRGRLWVTALQMGGDRPVTGWGPAAYSIEGVRYRKLAAVLEVPDSKADEPHSVPLAFWANGGLLGAGGFLFFGGWIVRVGRRNSSPDHLGTAFCAACVAYLVQASVSIDRVALGSALLTALVGMTASAAPLSSSIRPPDDQRVKGTPSRIVVASVVAALIIGGSGIYGGRLIAADHRYLRALELYGANQIDSAIPLMRKATEFRYEPFYLRSFGEQLGIAALERGRHGAPLIEEMKEVFGYLDDLPETFGLLAEARILHYWGRFQPHADTEVLQILERAKAMDPENPEIDIRISEVLIDLGREAEARDLLESWNDRVEGRLAGYWGALAIARLLDGDPAGAAAALSEGTSISKGDCRVLMALELLDRFDDGAREVSRQTTFAMRIQCDEGDFQYLRDRVRSLS